jgi:hypothetical protein
VNVRVTDPTVVPGDSLPILRAGELRMLGREIAAGQESRDYSDVQRKVVPVDEDTSVDAVCGLVHRAGEHHREGDTEQHEQTEPESAAWSRPVAARRSLSMAVETSAYATRRHVARTKTLWGRAARQVLIRSAARVKPRREAATKPVSPSVASPKQAPNEIRVVSGERASYR